MFNMVAVICTLVGAPVVLLCIFVMLVMRRREMSGNAMHCEVKEMLKEGNVPVLEYQTSDYRKLWASRCNNNKWFYEIREGYVIRTSKVNGLCHCNVSSPKSTFLLCLLAVCLLFLAEIHSSLGIACFIDLYAERGGSLIGLLFSSLFPIMCCCPLIYWSVMAVFYAGRLHKKAKLFNRKIEGMSGQEIEELYQGVYNADGVTE